MMGAIFSTTVPATIIRSDCRGVPRKTSAPKRARSNRASMTAIISIAQQASPNCIGQIEERRAQLMTESTVVVKTLSSKRLSSPMLLRPASGALGPVQGLALPDVEVADHQDHQENEHLDQAEEAELVEHHGPGEEKDRLDVEDDEEHRDQEVTDREPGIEGAGLRLHAALVRLGLDRVWPPRLDRPGEDDRPEREGRGEHTHDKNREIAGHSKPDSIGGFE